jgi:hypothetical protein
MENTPITSCSEDAAQIIAETTACSAALSTAIQRQNEVLLSSCQTLIEQTLKAMSSLKSLEIASSDSSATHNLEQLQSNAAQTIHQSVETLKNALPDDLTTAKHADAVDSLKCQSLKSFVDSSSILWANAVAAQQQFSILTQAATTQAIATILSVASQK